MLEDRTVPASVVVGPPTNIYQVTSTADSGYGSLRCALAHVNADPLGDIEIINFNIGGSGIQTINVASDLQLTHAHTTINGFSENASPGVLSIRLQGTATATNGLVVTGSGDTIEGIEFVGFHNTPTSAGLVIGPDAANNTIVGNDFGNTDRDIGGSAPVAAALFVGNGNAGAPPDYSNSIGILLGNGAHNNTIGGLFASAANVISGNAQAGIVVSVSDDNAILGNDIGTRSDGVTALGNAGPGIRIDGSNSTLIADNVIAYNGTSPRFNSGGVHIGWGNFNSIESNSIHDNAGLGIDLDGTANNSVPAPSIAEVSTPPGSVILQGTYRGAALATVTLQFFASAAVDPSGNGEGQTPIGADLQVTTDASGHASFTYAFAGSLPPGQHVITATATDSLGDTSEFSKDFTAVDDFYVTDPATPLTIAAPGVLGNDFDPDGQAHVIKVKGSVLQVGVPVPVSAGGAFTLNADGSFTFNPEGAYGSLAIGQSKTASITYTVVDGSVTSTATLQVTVAPIDNPPTLSGVPTGPQSSLDGQRITPVSVVSAFEDLDAGNDSLTYSDVLTLPSGQRFDTLPAGLSINPRTGAITGTVTGAPSIFPYQVTITATDKVGMSVSEEFAWTVTNSPPIAHNDSAPTDQDTSVGFGFDGDSDPSAIDPNANVVVNDVDVAPADPLHVTQVSTDGNFDDTVFVSPQQPVVVAGDNGGSFTIYANGNYSFSPGDDFKSLPLGKIAKTSITYLAADSGGSDTAKLTVTVTGLDDAPSLTGATINPGGQDPSAIQSQDDDTIHVATRGLFTDIDTGDAGNLTYTDVVAGAGTLPLGLSIDSGSGLIHGTIDALASQSSPYDVTITATDTSGKFVEYDFEWTVTNPPPVTKLDRAVTNQNTPIGVDYGGSSSRFNVLANDTDDDPIHVSAIEGSDGVVVPVTVDAPGVVHVAGEGTFTVYWNGDYSFNPDDDFAHLPKGRSARTSITYFAEDSQNAVTPGTLRIRVKGLDDAPTISDPQSPQNPNPKTYSVDQGQSIQIPLSDFDPQDVDDRDRLHVTFVSSPTFGQVQVVRTPDGLVLVYQQQGDLNPTDVNGVLSDQFAFEVTDKHGKSSPPVTVHLTINDVPPTATIVPPTNPEEGTPFTISMTDPIDVEADIAAGLHYYFAVESASAAAPNVVPNIDLSSVNYANTSTSSTSPPFTVPDNGVYYVYGVVIDQYGKYTVDESRITVGNVAPTADILITVPQPGTADLQIIGHDISPTDSAVGLRYSIDFGNAVFLGNFASYAGSLKITDSTTVAGTVAVPTALLNTNADLQVVVRVFDKDGGFTDYFVTVPHNTPEVVAAGQTAATTAVFEQSTRSSDQATDKAVSIAHELLTVDGILVRIEHGVQTVVGSDDAVDSKSGYQTATQQRQQQTTHIVTPTGLMFELNGIRTTAQIESLLTIPSSLQAGDDSVDLIVELLGPPDESTSPIRWAGLGEVADQATNADVANAVPTTAPGATGDGATQVPWVAGLIVAIVLVLGGFGWFFHRRRAIEVVIVEAAKSAAPSTNGSEDVHSTIYGGNSGPTMGPTAPGSVPDTST